MAKSSFKLNLRGLNELMKSAEMQVVLNDAANQLGAAANQMAQIRPKDGAAYEVESAHPISFVAIASVSASSFEGRLDNSKYNTLEKAQGSVSI